MDIIEQLKELYDTMDAEFRVSEAATVGKAITVIERYREFSNRYDKLIEQYYLLNSYTDGLVAAIESNWSPEELRKLANNYHISYNEENTTHD